MPASDAARSSQRSRASFQRRYGLLIQAEQVGRFVGSTDGKRHLD